MLPGKKYLPEDYLWIVWARKWFVIIPTVVIGAAVTVYAFSLPNRYRSTAVVQVVGQLVPEKMVQSTVTDTVSERLRAIQQQILSRTRLERIIDEFGLYTRERETMIMEDIVEQMRTRDLSINVNTSRGRRSDASSFNLSFTAESPRTAMLVAERLASLFVQENLVNRGTQAETTTQFFQTQLEEAKRKLQEHDERLTAFRQQHAGRLPTQAASNLTMMQTLQAQIQQNIDAANRERDRLTALESALADVTTAAGASSAAAATTGSAPAQTPIAQQLAAARTNLEGLQVRLTGDHPDVRQARRVVAELELKAEEEALSTPLASGSQPVAAGRGGVQSGTVSRVIELRASIQEVQASLKRRKQEDARLQAELASYASRVEAAPGVESEFADLMRDYNTMRENYETLLKQSEQARLAESLERRQIGEQFKVVDSARMPERPISPDRMRLNLLGLAAGLGLGLGLVALLEYRDTTFKTDTDVLISLSLPVLAVIPAMTNEAERRRLRMRHRAVALATSAMIALVGGAAIAWRLRLLDDWIR